MDQCWRYRQETLRMTLKTGNRMDHCPFTFYFQVMANELQIRRTFMVPQSPLQSLSFTLSHANGQRCCHAKCCQAHWEQFRVQCVASGHLGLSEPGIEVPNLRGQLSQNYAVLFNTSIPIRTSVPFNDSRPACTFQYLRDFFTLPTLKQLCFGFHLPYSSFLTTPCSLLTLCRSIPRLYFSTDQTD